MRGIAVYTAMRVALLAAVWLAIQVLTPMRGLLAIAVALVISGVISFIVLDRSRDRASMGLAGAFRRINDRIEQSKVAEDVDDAPTASGQGEPQAQQESVGEDEHTGGLQDRHEIAPSSAPDDAAQRTDGQEGGDEAEPREGQPEATR
ncbi:MAG: hypothetical protein RL134_1385 [Actinomycetota bacterium]